MKVIVKDGTGLIKHDCEAESKAFVDLGTKVQFTTKQGDVLFFAKEFYDIKRAVKGFGCQYVITEKDEADVKITDDAIEKASTPEELIAAMAAAAELEEVEAPTEVVKPKSTKKDKPAKKRKTIKLADVAPEILEEMENHLVKCPSQKMSHQTVYLAALGYTQVEIGRVLERENAQIRAYLVSEGLQHPKTTTTAQYKKYVVGVDALRDKLIELNLPSDVVLEVSNRCMRAYTMKVDIPHERVAEANKEKNAKIAAREEAKRGTVAKKTEVFVPQEVVGELDAN